MGSDTAGRDPTGRDPAGRAGGGAGGDRGNTTPRRRRATSGVSDPRAARARELHRKAANADALAARYRAERDRLIHCLREEDPQRWSYGAIATAVGSSRELVALILKRQRPTAR